MMPLNGALFDTLCIIHELYPLLDSNRYHYSLAPLVRLVNRYASTLSSTGKLTCCNLGWSIPVGLAQSGFQQMLRLGAFVYCVIMHERKCNFGDEMLVCIGGE